MIPIPNQKLNEAERVSLKQGVGKMHAMLVDVVSNNITSLSNSVWTNLRVSK
jgi:hypothetical protein